MNARFDGEMAMGWTSSSLCSCFSVVARCCLYILLTLQLLCVQKCSVLNRSFEVIVELIVDVVGAP